MEAYYYSKMNKDQQNVYKAMKTGLSALNSSFVVPRLDGSELQDVFFKLRLDYPEIFYVVSFRYRFYRDASNVEVLPEYIFDKKKVKEHQVAIKARINKLLRFASSMTEWDKELYIHDFICSHVRYDKLKKPYSHEIIGPLGQGVGVCEGIAKTVKALCDGLGIWCIIAISNANPNKNIKYRHAWNVVKIHGGYYHLDVTFNNSLCREDTIRYDYFNLDDKHFFRDHEPALYEIPECNSVDHFYYREKKLSFTKMDEITKSELKAMRKGRSLTFHWRGDYLTREVLSELLMLLEQTAQQREMHSSVGLNWGQAVLHVTFSKQVPDEEFIIEEVNEAEV